MPHVKFDSTSMKSRRTANLHVHDAENANEYFCVTRGRIESLFPYDDPKSNNLYSWV